MNGRTICNHCQQPRDSHRGSDMHCPGKREPLWPARRERDLGLAAAQEWYGEALAKHWAERSTSFEART